MMRRRRLKLPDWYDREFVLSVHVEPRMDDRDFNEAMLRRMLQTPREIRPAVYPGRFIVRCELDARAWVVVVEPDLDEHTVVVVTAYRPG